MTKLSCNIIKDLWILYENEECSEDSKKAVEEHLAQCKECQKSFKRLNLPEALIMPEEIKETKQTVRAVQKSVYKIKKRWIASIVMVLSILPLVVCGIMGVNQYRGEGICYSNLDEILVTKQFLTEAKEGNLKQAVQMVSFQKDYESVCEAYATESPNVVEISLGNEIWIVKPYFAEKWLEKTCYTEEETMELWTYFMNNVELVWGEICIPEEIWHQVEVEEKHVQYKILETEYGTFYEPQNELFLNEEMVPIDKEWITAMDLYARVQLIPKKIYEVVKLDLEIEIQENHEWLESLYGNVLELSLDDYTTQNQEKLLKAFETYEKTGAKIMDLQYEDSYYMEDGWRVKYRLIEQNRTGKEKVIVLEFSVEQGKVDLVAFHYKGNGTGKSETVLEDVVLNWKLEY